MLNKDEIIKLLKQEIVQLEEEGYDTGSFRYKLNKELTIEELMKLYNDLKSLKKRYGFNYYEPSELGEIRKERQNGPRILEINRTKLLDRIMGAWIGRCIGCMIGKPVEGLSRSSIEGYLKAINEYPLSGYFPLAKEFDRVKEYLPFKRRDEYYDFIRSRYDSFRENIKYMARDDDIDYTILNLHVLETYGTNFKTEDIAREWLSHLPYFMVYTAERVAYRNLVLGLRPPETAKYLNPYREWIGAQIRADIWGYISAGMPEKAAELAYRDASLSHLKNGIYGEMLMAAIIAASFSVNRIEDAIEIGLTEIPRRSRLYEAIRNVIKWSKMTNDWTYTWSKIMENYGRYNWVHTINNAAIVVMALMHGSEEFTKSVTIAVMSGLDTDCNGATVGSIIGAFLGYKRIPKSLIKPLNNRVRSAVIGFDNISITELADRTLRLALKNLNNS